MKPSFVVAAILVVSAAHGAAAQTFVNPFLDTTLTTPSASSSRTTPGVGLAFGKLRTAGLETEFAYHPELLDTAALAKSRVITFAENLTIGPMLGRVRPYGTIGAGDLLLNITGAKSVVVPDPESLSKNYFTLNYGGGAMAFIAPRLGLRGDLRYFRAYGLKLEDFGTTGLSFDRFDFWRASVGIVARF